MVRKPNNFYNGNLFNEIMEALLQQITSLRRISTKYGLAPHKPILLLAVIESFENGEIEKNQIDISEKLLLRFYDFWKLLVKTNDEPNFSLPFFNLGNERRRLWKLIPIPCEKLPTIKRNYFKSIKKLRDIISGAQLSDDFYLALSNHNEREVLKVGLLNAYFPYRSIPIIENPPKYSEEIKEHILNNDSENSTREVIQQTYEETIETKEEEMIIRSYIFRKAVLEIYDNRCAISGLKIESSGLTPLVDACHIVPFALAFDVTIRNGIAFTPTFHRAFDNGLIAISDNYRILIHPKLKGPNLPAGFKKIENKIILLPNQEKFYPSLQRLAEHRVRFGY